MALLPARLREARHPTIESAVTAGVQPRFGLPRWPSGSMATPPGPTLAERLDAFDDLRHAAVFLEVLVEERDRVADTLLDDGSRETADDGGAARDREDELRYLETLIATLDRKLSDHRDNPETAERSVSVTSVDTFVERLIRDAG